MHQNRKMKELTMLDSNSNNSGRSRCNRQCGYTYNAFCGGFTLIEIIIVVVILALTGMMIVPMINSAGSVQLGTAANVIAADMEYAKSMAISRGQFYSVEFDKTTESYRIKDQAGAVISHPVKKGFDYIVDFKNDGRLNKVDISDVSFNGTSEIKFDYLGSPYDGDDSALNSGVVTLQSGDSTITVVVEPVTGLITIP